MCRAYIADPPPPYGPNWGHQIVNFVFLPYVSLINAFTALECIKRYWEKIYRCKVYIAGQIYPLTPLYGSKWGNKIADFLFLLYISFKTTLLTNYSIYWRLGGVVVRVLASNL